MKQKLNWQNMFWLALATAGFSFLCLTSFKAQADAEPPFVPSTPFTTGYDLGQQLLRAADVRDWKQARTLLEQGADPNITSFPSNLPTTDWNWRARYTLERLSPLGQAAVQGNVDAVHLLLHYGANVNIRAWREPGPLIDAVEAGQTETARLLINAGADLDTKDFALTPVLTLVH